MLSGDVLLSHTVSSTIGAERLDFRVRNVAGYFPLAMVAVTLLRYQNLGPTHTNTGS
jgi:hypothetical protein